MSEHTSDNGAGQIAALRSFEANTKVFHAGGHTYHVEDNLSIERYKHFQRLEIELGFSLSFSDLFGKLREAYEKQNNQKFADVSVLLYNLLEGSVQISEKKPVALYVATLFINRSDEDRTVWSKVIADQKLEDWRDIDANFFLITALSRVNGFRETIREISQMIETVGVIKDKADEVSQELL